MRRPEWLSKVEAVCDCHFKPTGGGGWFMGKCPFHEDRTPSFGVHEKGTYNCFGCGVTGLVKNLINEPINNKYIIPHKSTRPAPHALTESLVRHGRQCDYEKILETRGITKLTLKRVEAVRLVIDDDISTYEPWYWESLRKRFGYKAAETHLFPIRHNGYWAGGQLYFPGEKPKYLTLPKSHRGTTIQDFSHPDKDWTFVAEGQFDFLTLLQLGFPVVFIYSINLTEAQAKLLPPHIKRAVFFFDCDKAGLSAYKIHPVETKSGEKWVQGVKEKMAAVRPDIECWKYIYPTYHYKTRLVYKWDANALYRADVEIRETDIRKIQ